MLLLFSNRNACADRSLKKQVNSKIAVRGCPPLAFLAIKHEINQIPDAFHSPIKLFTNACCIVPLDESMSITTAISSQTVDQKSQHLAKAAEYYSQAKDLIEDDQNWQACGSMILKALAEERKSENTGLQVMSVIKYQKPKTKLEFKFRS